MQLAVKVFQLFETIGRMLLNVMLKPFQVTISDEQWDSLMQFVKFGMVGVSNTLVYYIVYAILVMLGTHIVAANTIAYFISIVNSFYWNNKYVFQQENKKRSMMQAFLKCCLSYVGTYLLSTVLLLIWVDLFHISKFIGPLLTIVITTPLNFIMNKVWAFRTE